MVQMQKPLKIQEKSKKKVIGILFIPPFLNKEWLAMLQYGQICISGFWSPHYLT